MRKALLLAGIITFSAPAFASDTVSELLEVSTYHIRNGDMGKACLTMREALDEGVRQDLSTGFIDRQIERTIEVCGKAWR